ncbi:MAG: hypothetical protein Q9162_002558 [Coniocarpon cinnabarinum]
MSIQHGGAQTSNLLRTPVPGINFRTLNTVVPEPYLDEIFHIPQAQRYCENDLQWDPKITTPPGLYILSRLAKLLGVPCTEPGLRGLNSVLTLLIILPASFLIRASSNSFALDLEKPQHQAAFQKRMATDLHTAINVCLFPPLFFFTAMYYTDVSSTAVVLLFLAVLDGRSAGVGKAGQRLARAVLECTALSLILQGYWGAGAGVLLIDFLLHRMIGAYSGAHTRPSSMYTDVGIPSVVLLILGLLALLLRQTNVFWVAVFPIGWRLLSHSPRRKPANQKGFLGIYPERPEGWASIINPTIEQSSPSDVLRTALSVPASLVFHIAKQASGSRATAALVQKLFVPFVTLGGCFAAFVVWNGGVVLGDKSNHVATIHLPQMLYLWPYMAFFSWPMMYPYAVTALSDFLGRVSGLRLPPAAFLKPFRTDFPIRDFGHFAQALLSVAVITTIVHQNTIVHPFTLADNRHYVFYAFRLVVLGNPTKKYIAAPFYLICGWLSIRTLGTPKASLEAPSERSEGASREYSTQESKTVNTEWQAEAVIDDTKIKSPSVPAPDQVETRIGFMLLWTMATALCIITAPLVEPRYYILPWILWRLQVPSTSALQDLSVERDEAQEGRDESQPTVHPWSLSSMIDSDHRLWFETGWFLIINLMTAYLFLYREFEWPQEPEKAQRFIW